jgi:serine/threonine-protein kinase
MAASDRDIRVVETRGDGASRVGKYHYIAALAQGGMADVYLAVMKGPIDIDKLVVVKEMRRELTDDPDFVGMFLDEARLAARLNHPNVVQTYEVGSEDGRYFLAMEFLDGLPYVRVLRMKDRIPVPFAIHARILCDILAGLHYAHELTDFDGTPLHVVHRDVSPQNVLVTFGGGVKLVDFGIAKATTAAERRTGDVKGKLAYMAPEQLRTFDVDRRADIFCVGVMLWEAITRRRLWGPQGKPSIEQLLGDEIPDVRSVRKEVPDRLARICARALARDPAERYATAAEMEHDLDEYLSQSGQQTSAREVGNFVAGKFTREREALRVAIDAQIRKLRALPPDHEETIEIATITIPQAAPSEGAPLSVPPGPASSPLSSTQTASSMSGVRRRDSVRVDALPPPPLVPASAPPAPWLAPSSPLGSAAPAPASAAPEPRRRVVPLAVMGALLMAAAGMAAVAVRMSAQGGAPSARSADSARATETAPTPAAAPAAAPTPTEGEIELRVKATPAGARVSIDGAPAGTTPFVGKRPRDGRTHVIRVEARGYETKVEEVSFDKDAYLALELHRAWGTLGPARGAPPPPATPKAQPGAKPAIDVDSPYK